MVMRDLTILRCIGSQRYMRENLLLSDPRLDTGISDTVMNDISLRKELQLLRNKKRFPVTSHRLKYFIENTSLPNLCVYSSDAFHHSAVSISITRNGTLSKLKCTMCSITKGFHRYRLALSVQYVRYHFAALQ